MRDFSRRGLVAGLGAAVVTAALPVRAAAPARTDPLAGLLAGNRRFAAGTPRYGHDVAAAAATSGGQAPTAVVIGCIDSRVPLEAIFDQTFGSICVVRSGAGVLDRAGLGSVEFAVTELGVRLVLMLGHERCGAIAATVAALRAGAPRGYLMEAIAPSVLEEGLHRDDVAERALRRHVTRTVDQLRTVGSGWRVRIAGGVYDLDTGRVELLP